MKNTLLRFCNLVLYSLWYLLRKPLQLVRGATSIKYMEAASLYPGYLRQGNGLAFCLEHAKKYCEGKGVDVGAGMWPFPGSRAIEYSEIENALLICEDDNSLDYVFSSHCLEHLEGWIDALQEWVRICKIGGFVYLYLPHPAAELWHKDILPFHKWNPTPQVVIEALEGLRCEIVDSSYFPDAYLSFYVVARKG